MSTSERPLRADAQRNRDQILSAAARAFSRCGLEATLEAIAKDAGVGIGTLYRHFPSREALVEAVYRDGLGRLCEGGEAPLGGELERLRAGAAPLLGDGLEPTDALRAWMGRYADFVATKRDMGEALRVVIA